ncbi:PREDICTED: GTP-binding protein A-like, partial [Amphimedon queenslandica]
MTTRDDTMETIPEINQSIVPASLRNLNEEEVRMLQEAIQRLSERGEPINILVIGPTGVGKSTLINALLGDAVQEGQRATEGQGAAPVQSEVEVHTGKYEGIEIKVYDTTGFGDTRGKSDVSIIEEIAKDKKFDLVLICMRMDCRVNEGVKKMFSTLGDMMNKEMWDRSVVVLTFVNTFLQQKSIKKLPNQADLIK